MTDKSGAPAESGALPDLKGKLIVEESIWCGDCGEIRPVRYDHMRAVKGLNDHDATDIMCDQAHIIATLHHPHALAKFLGANDAREQ